MSEVSDSEDIEMVKKGRDVEPEGDKLDADMEESSSSSSEEEIPHDIEVPLFVFLWTYLPWKLRGHITVLILTHCCIFCAFGVLLCNYGYAHSVCTWIGLLGFLSCMLGLNKIQSYGAITEKLAMLQKQHEKLNLLMGKYEDENRALKAMLVQLEQQSEILKKESSKLSEFNAMLNDTTDEYESRVRDFRRERLKLAETFSGIEDIVDTLEDKESDVQKRCIILRRELKKLRSHNLAIAKTYNSLVIEHQNIRETNELMSEEIKKFEEMRQGYIDQRDILKNSMNGNLKGLETMMENYEILYLQEIAHNTEFLDGQAGMTADKYVEFMRRIPKNIPVTEDNLISLFEQQSNEEFICDHEAMRRIIVEIVKASAGIPGALSGGKQDEKTLAANL